MTKIVLLSHEKNAPRENCEICKHSGLVSCGNCGGKGWTDCLLCGGTGRSCGLTECSCENSGEKRPKCSVCGGKGNQKCECVRICRFIWEDDILGHKTRIYMMAEQGADESWAYSTRETTQTPWQAMPATDKCAERVAQIQEMIDAGNNELREILHAFVKGLPDDTNELSKAQNILKEFQ
jgi:hypothetical protein